MSTKPVAINANFRLNVSSDRNFIVEERVMVDPTKSPNWKKRIAENPAADPSPHEAWREAPLPYYSLTFAGLNAAIQYVILRTGNDSDSESLAELIAEYQREMARLSALISEAIMPTLPPAERGAIYGESGDVVASE